MTHLACPLCGGSRFLATHDYGLFGYPREVPCTCCKGSGRAPACRLCRVQPGTEVDEYGDALCRECMGLEDDVEEEAAQ